MPNITTDQSKLVLNMFAATFQNNLVSADLVTWKKHDNEMNDRNALTVSEQVGPRYVTTRTTSGVKDLTAGVQDTVFGSEQFSVRDTFGSSMGWGDFQKIRDIGSARESEALKNAAVGLAETIDAYILNVCATASNNWTGTPANNVATLGAMSSAYTRLKEEGVDDADLKAVLTYNDRAALSDTVVAYNATDSMSTLTFRKGFDGEINGIPTMFTQQLPLMTLGTRTNGAVNGAALNVNYKAVAVSGAPGQYLTQTLSVDGLGANATIKKGEVFTIAGVNAYDNRLKASLGRLQQFTVVEDTIATAGGAVAALRIFPAIIVPGSGTGADVDVNTAHATVTAAPADNAVITFLGTASTDYKPRLLMQKGAVQVNTAPLIMPASGKGASRALSKVPVTVRMWQDSDFATGEHKVRFDVALTANIRDRRRMTRFNGA